MGLNHVFHLAANSNGVLLLHHLTVESMSKIGAYTQDWIDQHRRALAASELLIISVSNWQNSETRGNHSIQNNNLITNLQGQMVCKRNRAVV